MVKIDKYPVYDAVLAEGDGMIRVSLVDSPAVMTDFKKFSEDKPVQMYSVEDEEKHLILGCVMRADFPLFRRDERLGEYYIIFKADTIREMAEKYLLDGKQNAVDLSHDGSEVDGVNLVQYFIKDTAKGINPEGFENCKDGSLFAEYHVTDEAIWQDIKDGKFKGFSIEVTYNEVPETDAEEVREIVKDTHGIFNKLNMSKVSKLMFQLAKALESKTFKSVSTDKGILVKDGDADFAVGDEVRVQVEGEVEDTEVAAEDGNYTLEGGEVYVIADGKIIEINEPNEVEIVAEDGDDKAVEFGEVVTDNGTLYYEGEEDLKAGDAVYTKNEDGENEPAADGSYTTEDGKVIVVVDGTVTEIKDPDAEVAPEEEGDAFSRRVKFESESYDEKYHKIADAISEVYGLPFYLVEAADDYAIIQSADGVYIKYDVAFDDDDNCTVSNPRAVRQVWEEVEPEVKEEPAEPEEPTAAEAFKRMNAKTVESKPADRRSFKRMKLSDMMR